jgi:hypothetical protein
MAVCVLLALAAVAGARPPMPPYEAEVAVPETALDRAAAPALQRAGLKPAPLCSDAVFLRRVHVDVIGRIPTLEEVREFAADPASDKRARCIDRLLEREEFADYWAMKWCEVLRVKSEFPVNLWPNAAQAYHGWIRARIRENAGWDRVARDLLTASGGCGREPAVNFFRAVPSRDAGGMARAAALTMMGERVDRWPRDRFEGFAAFFCGVTNKGTLEWKEEIVCFDPTRVVDTNGRARTAMFPDGRRVVLSPERDPRVMLADWLFAPGNPVFPRCMANRTWAWLFGRGLIDEADDIRPDNPPSHPELLAWLQREWVSGRHDFKHLLRVILNSRTYQASPIPDRPDARAARMFACYPVRRLDAEVLVDALCDLSGKPEEYSSQIPEPFTFLPTGGRAVTISDGSITSSVLELFGRPSREMGLMRERVLQPTPAQELHLLNSSHVRGKLASPGLRELARGARSREETVQRVYQRVLAREPTLEEIDVIRRHAGEGAGEGRDASIDLAWALVNSMEFQTRH